MFSFSNLIPGQLNLKLIGLALAAVAAFGAYKYVGHLHAEVATLQAANTELSTKLKIQNDAVLQMQKDADARIALHKQELDAAKQAAQAAQGKAQIIYKKIPSTPTDTCKSALDLLNGGLQ